MNSVSACRCNHHMVVPILIVLLGLVFVLQNMGVMSAALVMQTWPFIVILIGLVKLFSGKCKCYEHAS